jgi:hypothetical protein
MANVIKSQPEYAAYRRSRPWTAIADEQLLTRKLNPLLKSSKLFAHLYELTQKTYQNVPSRKNGENAIGHPLNIVIFLQQAGITDEITLCAGLIHDLVEEEVDIYRDENQIKGYRTGLNQLDIYEHHVVKKIKDDLIDFSKQQNIPSSSIDQLIDTVQLLTKHKKDFYYQYIANIFKSTNKNQERAIQIKLADRLHNILCIQCFVEEERIFQCFKNLFILNNSKRYIIQHYGKASSNRNESTTEILFKKCSKATYSAFLNICHLCIAKGMGDVKYTLQLAFKKFALEKAGVWEVTELQAGEQHLMRLYHNIIRKYDFRLYHKWKQFEDIKKEQKLYCEKYFSDYNFSAEKIAAIIDYKDAYALKEVVAYLLYLPEYTLGGFEANDLFNE